LMGLLKAFIRRDLAELHRENVRVRIIGDRQGLKNDIRSLLEEAEQMTADNTKLTLVIAFNYGSRDEIARATASIAL
ncbi:undecaprenyl diphosphate synthase family protein, partial [Staphylococcus aureus]